MTTSLQLYTGFFQEINETLANIDSAAQWIRKQNRESADSETVRKEIHGSLGQIRDEILRGRKTIHQLINFSLSSDPLVSDIDINSMLEEMTELFRREIYFNNVRIVRNYQEMLPIIRNNPPQIRQVFQNLMLNALAAVEKGGEIHLTTRRLDHMIRVTIWDNGPGIPPGVAEKIFDPLFTTQPGKLGLGLSICRTVLEKTGGAIIYESAPERGTAFVVDLPFRVKKGNGKSV